MLPTHKHIFLVTYKSIAWGKETGEIEHPSQSGQMGGVTLKIMGGFEDQRVACKRDKTQIKKTPCRFKASIQITLQSGPLMDPHSQWR